MNRDKKRLLEAMLVGLRDELVGKYQETDRIRLDIQAEENEDAQGFLHSALQDEKRIRDIDHAINRLRLNRYDRCESCGGRIEENLLLESLPWMTMCPDCANAIGVSESGSEKEEQDFPFQ